VELQQSKKQLIVDESSCFSAQGISSVALILKQIRGVAEANDGVWTASSGFNFNAEMLILISTCLGQWLSCRAIAPAEGSP